MQIPPEDSIFSLPIWKKSSNDYRTKKVQMNPSTAFQGSSITAIALGMVAVVLIVVLGSTPWFRSQPTVDVQASFDMKRSITGTINDVNKETNTIILYYGSSPDLSISQSYKKNWTITLPPGASLTRQSYANMNICYSLSDLKGSLSSVVPGSCEKLLQTGRKALIEYVVVHPTQASLIAKTILVEIPQK